MPLERHVQFAQLWLEQVRDRLAEAGATSASLPPEQLNILSGKVAEGLRIFIEATHEPPAHREAG
ncbi:DUF6374 family protein [Nocardia terpenica]|uniref:Uncharacterized protein n=1 Tax=Nocardia terpenica TaxID=455432 RepID=A0A164HE06_9NOCA|nr:DUF6374 family protein [Nocardia terpenica]ATL65049.1 hypothetical protein CRH09_01195 [Nocardia terpenica]KZM68432.1 hypothetical protein AWN90_11180 [Nocardia terpenica]MBF6065011.1 hypothetical protein [Nocardia terpenica]MBF6108068.1 hypothetical protein [Nocardia terpenica]MBF6115283.1 hypothetical protein [Nocardia terpenica]